MRLKHGDVNTQLPKNNIWLTSKLKVRKAPCMSCRLDPSSVAFFTRRMYRWQPTALNMISSDYLVVVLLRLLIAISWNGRKITKVSPSGIVNQMQKITG